MERVKFDFEEYRALRSEIIQSMDDGNKILSFGLASIGIVLAAGLKYKNEFLGFIVMVFFLPLLTALILSLWFAAQQRIARASYYLTGVEARIKAACNDSNSVSWEAWLRAKKPKTNKSEHFWSTEQAGIGLFIIIVSSSIFMGAFCSIGKFTLITKIFAISISVFFCGAIIFNVIFRYLKWKEWLSTHFDQKHWDNQTVK
jgi:hypothetical protein